MHPHDKRWTLNQLAKLPASSREYAREAHSVAYKEPKASKHAAAGICRKSAKTALQVGHYALNISVLTN